MSSIAAADGLDVNMDMNFTPLGCGIGSTREQT